MKLDPRKHAGPGYEHPVDEINWTAGVGQPAGIYWLAGESLIAAHESPAEDWLVAQGAVLIATLRFDRDLLDGRSPGARVERMAAGDVSAAFLVSDVN
jgi:hypothetical protein